MIKLNRRLFLVTSASIALTSNLSYAMITRDPITEIEHRIAKIRIAAQIEDETGQRKKYNEFYYEAVRPFWNEFDKIYPNRSIQLQTMTETQEDKYFG